ncbi:Type 1 glutamine amidotransferase-like domain-containing protein [Candidatus Villigracilis saccharophilus]|uniref:Type 1 glutamine amidotransferase-like domain-containing protein n=1 Tax=Candidatus Villigracilis saccharophilus TaxID=3140684 RepID=UPI0031360962|nr:Type 1 glutamine amidotransferase-like domain-containing protein [Anaerolineales bacterium]
MPNLHLFSSPGKDDIRYIIEASRPYLKDKDDATVAYLPLASLYAERWQVDTENSFKSLARLETINAETMSLTQMEDIIRRASLVYIPGGNTFLLNHRLHVSRLMLFLRKKVQAGLPVVAFSAGAILCGPNILTSKDMNTVATSTFEGLNVTPFNFSPHYPLDAYGQSVKDEWLADYHFFHDNPVVMMSDGAYVKVIGKKTTLVRGEAWILRKGQEKEKLEEHQLITL